MYIFYKWHMPFKNLQSLFNNVMELFEAEFNKQWEMYLAVKCEWL